MKPDVWAVWQPGRRPGWAGTHLGRRWELIQHSPTEWTLRFVDGDGGVTKSDSGSVAEIAAVIRRSAITAQPRRRLREALEHPDELGVETPFAVCVN